MRFRRVRHHRQHDEGELLEVLESAADRVVPRCAHFGTCGGCALQHLAPAAQLAAKRTELADALERIGRVQPQSWLAPLEGPSWGYRRRARLGAKYVSKRGRVLVGFRERAKPYVAALERCEILAPPVDALLAPLSQLLSGLAVREQLPQIEVAVGDGATALVLRVLTDPGEPDLAALAAFEARARRALLPAARRPGNGAATRGPRRGCTTGCRNSRSRSSSSRRISCRSTVPSTARWFPAP
ncbi:MAG: hypothetical protein U1F11_09385 [Steroidobacteraceae bacterium]